MNLPGNSEIREFMDQLTASTNVAQHVELPTIVAMGGASSGKSSLLSSVSLLELPCSNSFTTRCPIRLHMTKADQKKAIIGVQWNQKPSAQTPSEKIEPVNSNTPMLSFSTDVQSPVKEVSNSASAPESDFSLTVSSTSKPVARRIFSFGKVAPEFQEITITEEKWHLLPEMIEKAQNHIIDVTGKEIARDTVTVEVSGPECYDLTLVDLPCIVRPRGMNEKETVDDINCIINDYLENKRCVILAVIPANENFQNSQIMAEVLKVDPETKRTIPVITKSDLIHEGRENDILQLLMAKNASFELGFHVVKCRGEAALDRKETIEDSVIAEKDFFSMNDPWRSIEDRAMLGTENLRRKLGDLQMRIFRDTIPSIIREVSERRDAANNQLLSMGEVAKTVSEKRHFFSSLADTLLDFMKRSISGKGIDWNVDTNASACSELRQEFDKFCAVMGESKLVKITHISKGTSVLVRNKFGCGGEIRGKVAAVYDTFACVHYVDEKDRKSKTLFEATGQPEDNDWKEGAYLEGMDSLKGNYFVYRGGGKRDQFRNIPLEEIRTDPAWLKDIISTNCTEDLACFLNAAVFNRIVAKFIDEDWKSPSLDLVDKTASILRKGSQIAFRNSRGATQYPGVQELIEQNIEDAIRDVAYASKLEVERHLEMEKVPYTQDSSLFENIAKKRNQHLYNEINHALIGEGTTEKNVSPNAIKEILRQVFERNQRKTVETTMAEELELLLEAYGKVVFKRVQDQVPMICRGMTQKFLENIKKSLQNVTDETLEDVVKYSRASCREREAREHELEQMEKSLQIFQRVLSKRSILEMDSSCVCPSSKRPR